ncbi:MAG: PilZ domain-containing protein [Gammaproteobacteria bacterium]
MSATVAALHPEADSSFAALSPEELAAIAHVLALGIAQHRMKFGVIPLTSATTSAHGVQLREEARSSLREALHLVREQARQAAAPSHSAPVPPVAPVADAAFTLREQRRQLRVSVNAAVQLGRPDGSPTCKGNLRNISWGGASVRCAALQLHAGERVRLMLPIGKGEQIETLATVLRSTTVNDATEYGLRFDSMTAADEARLEKVLDILIATPDSEQRRGEARIVQRLEIEYGDYGEFSAVLEDISASGVMLTVPDPLEIDQSLLVTLSGADTHHSLSLRARVVHQTLVTECGMDMYRVGLKFEHPDNELRERVSAVLHQLAALRPVEIESEEAP